ncbi:hypothetical protein [Longirhabdus pacifica]|uniref:hypothetical protein n=1 Tax=Longirhabdus pacifica TaxID=2305227 RepID=UPI001008F471|nr:hypothetical protein [Longirhabdus pacifica]
MIFSIVLLFTGCQSQEIITDGKYTYKTLKSIDAWGVSIEHENQGEQPDVVFLPMVKLPYGNQDLNSKWGRKAHNLLSDSLEKEDVLTVTILDRDFPISTGFVKVKDQDIAIWFLEQGFLIVDHQSEYKSQYHLKFQEYVAVEEIAIEKGVGIWAHLNVRGEN